ncbi:hypothetical protein NDK50_01255 [Paraburkholderia bryophila]|uniref:hypothetical protein n=1 Tax=Paraburkholderia bryophila TaxID=420952 RepID=UPI0023494795|nr:hypothetical protein [Paraburkholderia bryophila]WCM20136.1 hypothetical protein NDK50_01255 [Paraburkholderia bryophila]
MLGISLNILAPAKIRLNGKARRLWPRTAGHGERGAIAHQAAAPVNRREPLRIMSDCVAGNVPDRAVVATELPQPAPRRFPRF